jgi:hypothetical protein
MSHKCNVKPLVGTGDDSGTEFEVSCKNCSFTFTATSDTFAKAIKSRHETVGAAHGG